MLQKAITFPTEGDDAVKTILLGGVFSLFSFLIAPGLLVYGYMVEVYRAGVNGDDEPPTFSDWDDLAFDGLQVIAIFLAYYVIPGVIFFWGVFAGSTGTTTTTGGMATSTGPSTTMMVSMGVSGLLFIIASYLLPAAVANFATEDSIAAAFSFGTLKDAVLTGDYFVGCLMVIAVAIPFGVVNFALALIPFLGYIASMFVGFYFQIVMIYILGRSFAKALDIEPETGGGSSAGAEVPA